MTDEDKQKLAEQIAEKAMSAKNVTYAVVLQAVYKAINARDEEIKELQLELNNAVSILKDVYEDYDYFCTMLLDIDEEAKICGESCENLNEKCILRYLKHYKKGE